MRIFHKSSVIILGVSLVVSLAGPITVHAATAPVLGVASGYSVFGNAGVTNNSSVGTTHVWGNVGGNAAGGGTGVTNLDDTTQVDGAIDAGANASVVGAISFAYGDLADETQTGVGVTDLAASPAVGPGVYNVAATAFNSTLTLSGEGVYIFRSTSSIARTAGGTMLLTNGATACNVFWQIPTSMTFATGVGSIYGTIITNTGLISFADTGVTLQGRAWAATQVTMINTVITEPTCTVVPSPSPTNNNTITVFKQVINDNGGTALFTDFPLFINGNRVDSGESVSLAPGSYTVTETSRAGYATTFTGNCNASGVINHGGINTHNDICTVVNNDIGIAAVVVPPLIDVVKVPSPLALPVGPGPVNYTYTLRNIGTIPVTNVTMLGDTCSPIVLVSGDTDADSALDVTETWIYTCSTTLSATHTNTVVATGQGNGLTAVDVASATVVVGAPIVPPLIHVTKVPSPLTLPAGPGNVTYTKTVTNPGTVALSNVGVTDDKCGSINYISGDVNSNSLLDTSETWIYTCEIRLTQTTTNTVTATGSANGLIATDFAIATVVVAVPKLPATGFPPEATNNLLTIVMFAGMFVVSLLFNATGKNKSPN